MKILLGTSCTHMTNIAAIQLSNIFGPTFTFANVIFTPAEFDAVLKYDKARHPKNPKIIGEVVDTTLTVQRCCITILNNAVESGNVKITELEITSTDPLLGLYHHSTVLTSINFRTKHLHIRALDYSFDILAPHLCKLDLNIVTSFIKRYKGIIDQLTLHFKKVSMDFFSKIYEELESWIISAPLNISLTAEKDAHNRLCESLPEYNDIQAKIKLVSSCILYSKPFANANKTIDERTQEYKKIVNNDPEFIKNFSKCEASVAKKIMGDNMYSTFLRCYISNSTIVKTMSEYCYNYTQHRGDGRKPEYLPYNAQECVVKYIGGIAAITEIDNNLKNSTTAQQDLVINQAEAMNDVDLITSVTVADSDCSDSLFNC